MLLYLFTTKHIFILYLLGTINVKFLPIKIIKINWFDNKPRIILGETATSEKKLTSTCPLFLFIMLWHNKIRYLDFGIGRLVTRCRSRPSQKEQEGVGAGDSLSVPPPKLVPKFECPPGPQCNALDVYCLVESNSWWSAQDFSTGLVQLPESGTPDFA
jgi:hypothetical protein